MEKQQTIGVVEQIRRARKNSAALSVGSLLGGLMPASSFVIGHYEMLPAYEGALDTGEWFSVVLPALMVLGGLVFSAITVRKWTQDAFNHKAKALGFTVLAELVMTFSSIEGLAWVMLGYLVVINAVATGCILANRDAKDREENAPDVVEVKPEPVAKAPRARKAPAKRKAPVKRKPRPSHLDLLPVPEPENDNASNLSRAL